MKKQILVRVLMMLLSLTLVCSLFVACTEPDDGNTDATEITTTSANGDQNPVTTTDSVTDVENVTDPIPSDVKYDNKTMRVLYWQDREHEEFFAEDGTTGDPVSNALFSRNARVEDRLGIEIVWEGQDGDSGNNANWNSRMQTIIADNSEGYTAFAGYSLSVAAAAVNGYCYNLLSDDCSYLNFDNNTYWPERLLSEIQFGDNLYFCSGDISANALYMMYVCYVNTDIIEEHQLDNPQDFVVDGNWTYNRFINMCQGIYIDTDGSGTKTEGDTFGYLTSELHTDPWFYGTGARIAEYNANGDLQMSPSINSNEVIDTITKIHDLLYDSDFAMFTDNAGKNQRGFGEGRTLFLMDRARVSFKVIYDGGYDVNYVIVPCPKYNAKQESYVTLMGNPFTLYGIFASASEENREAGSAFLEYYAYQSHLLVTPAVFEISLKLKYVADSISGQMYDIIRENLSFDPGRIFSSNIMSGDIGGQNFIRRPYVSAKTPTWASEVERVTDKINANCTTVQNTLDT